MNIEYHTERALAAWLDEQRATAPAAVQAAALIIRAWHDPSDRGERSRELVVAIDAGGDGGIGMPGALLLRTNAHDQQRTLLDAHYATVDWLKSLIEPGAVTATVAALNIYAAGEGLDARLNGISIVDSGSADGRAALDSGSAHWGTDLALLVDGYLAA